MASKWDNPCGAWKYLDSEPKKYGTYRKPNELVNELPPIGSMVYVESTYTSFDEKGMYFTYKLDNGPNYVDGHGTPRLFKVISYSKGIDNPFNKQNRVQLESTSKNGRVVKVDVYTYLVATGSMRLRIAYEQN